MRKFYTLSSNGTRFADSNSACVAETISRLQTDNVIEMSLLRQNFDSLARESARNDRSLFAMCHL